MGVPSGGTAALAPRRASAVGEPDAAVVARARFALAAAGHVPGPPISS